MEFQIASEAYEKINEEFLAKERIIERNQVIWTQEINEIRKELEMAHQIKEDAEFQLSTLQEALTFEIQKYEQTLLNLQSRDDEQKEELIKQMEYISPQLQDEIRQHLYQELQEQQQAIFEEKLQESIEIKESYDIELLKSEELRLLLEKLEFEKGHQLDDLNENLQYQLKQYEEQFQILQNASQMKNEQISQLQNGLVIKDAKTLEQELYEIDQAIEKEQIILQLQQQIEEKEIQINNLQSLDITEIVEQFAQEKEELLEQNNKLKLENQAQQQQQEEYQEFINQYINAVNMEQQNEDSQEQQQEDEQIEVDLDN